MATKKIKALCLEVIDGDTIVAYVKGRNVKVRLLGIDTPELNEGKSPQEGAYEATDYLRKTLEGVEIILEYDDSLGRRDQYQRELAYVHTSDETDIQEELLRKGLAKVYRGSNFSRKKKYLGCEQKLKKALQAKKSHSQ